MRHDLVWLGVSQMPYTVTRQRTLDSEKLDVAQCLSADKSILSRVASTVPVSSIIRHEKPILLSKVLNNSLLPKEGIPRLFMGIPVDTQQLILELCNELAREGVYLRIYGSYSWQHFTQKQFVHAKSDLDLLIYVDYSFQLDDLKIKLDYLELLLRYSMSDVYLDGEFAVAGKYFVAIREWYNESSKIVVKTNHDVYMMDKDEWRK